LPGTDPAENRQVGKSKGRLGLKFRFLVLFLSVLVAAIGILTLFVETSLRRVLQTMEYAELESHVRFSEAYMDALYPGPWQIDEDDRLMKGKHVVSGDQKLVTDIAQFTKAAVTIFKGPTRVATTVLGADGKPAVGTKASQKVIDHTLVGGKVFTGPADVLGTRYESSYFPLRDSSGALIGMVFVGINHETYNVDLQRLRLHATLLSLGMLVVIIPLIWFVVGRYLAPLRRLIDWATQVSSGDLNAEFAGASHKIRDEIGELSWVLREMIINLRQMILVIQDTAGGTKKNADELVAFSHQFATGAQDQAAASEEASAAMEQMAASAESVTERVGSSVQSMEAINHSLSLLSRSNKEVRSSIDELVDVSRSASEKAKGGEEQIRAATEAMNLIQQTSSKITEFVSIITEISDRTNLLSLNAAIEAARAGDAGRGFAVVAQEITKLADRTLASAKEVTALMDASLESIRKGTKQVGAVAGNLGGIVQDVQKIDRLAGVAAEKVTLQVVDTQNIADNSSALTSTSGEILTSLSEQRRATREIESTIGNVSATAQSVNTGTQELLALAESLRKQSDELMMTVARFQL
jgi:methyl-accepting chemotaxis protein